MAESTLSAAFKDLQGDVGFFLGFGRGSDNGETAWDTYQQSSIDRCVKGGLRNFYHCGYDWSFLKPIASLTLLSGYTTVPLPDDYGGVEGQINFTDSSSSSWGPLNFVGIGSVDMAAVNMPDTTGRPQICAAEPIKGTGANQGQRYQLRIWPTADAAYTLRFAYYLNPDYLTGAFPFAYGGPEHAETMLESCLAVAEKVLDDTMSVHEKEFGKRLAVSMDLDRRKKPQMLGYNRDMSDYKQRFWRADQHGWAPITVYGVQY